MVVWGSGYEGAAAPSWWPWLDVVGVGRRRHAPAAACRELEQLLHPSADDAAEVSPTRRFELHEAVRRAI